jgi:hypothetical protein
MAYDPSNPYAATVAELLDSCLKLNAGTMKLTGDDANGKPVFIVLVAVKDEAARLAPEIERLTANEEAAVPGPRRKPKSLKRKGAPGQPAEREE